MGLPNPSRETKFSGANGEREKNIFSVQLTTMATLPGWSSLLLFVMAIQSRYH